MGVKGSGVIERAKRKLAAAFEMVETDPSVEVGRDRDKRTLKLSQPANIDKILAKFHLDQAKPRNTSMKETLLLPNEGNKATLAERERHQGMTESLMFSMVETRPDIAFPISVQGQSFCQEP